MTKIISVVNCLKDTGKTQTALRLAKLLASYGHKCLLVDADPHATLTGLQQLPRPVLSWYSSFKADKPFEPRELTDNLSIITSEGELAHADFERSLETDFPNLKAWLLPHFAGYDFVLIDTPAAAGFLAQSMVAISDSMILPRRVDDMFLMGLKRNNQTLEEAGRFGQPNQIIAVFPKSVNVNPRAPELYPAIEEYVKQHLASFKYASSRSPANEPVWKFLGLTDYYDIFMELL